MSITSIFCPAWALKLTPPTVELLNAWADQHSMAVAADTDGAEWLGILQRAAERGLTMPDLSGAEWELGWRGEFGRRMHALLTVGTTCGCCHGWRVYALMLAAQMPFIMLGLATLATEVLSRPGGVALMALVWNANMVVLLWLAGGRALRHKELTERE